MTRFAEDQFYIIKHILSTRLTRTVAFVYIYGVICMFGLNRCGTLLRLGTAAVVDGLGCG